MAPDALRIPRADREIIDEIVQDAWNVVFRALDDLLTVDVDHAGEIATIAAAQLRRLLESTVSTH